MTTSKIFSLESATKYLSDQGLISIVNIAESQPELGVNEKLSTVAPYKPDLVDLAKLHNLVISKKRTTVLEFGTGWSSLVLADALNKLKETHQGKMSMLRRKNAFELHVLDNQSEYIEISKARINEKLRENITFYESNVNMGSFNDRICHFYDKIPEISPDLIYLDGPDQFEVKGNIAGYSTRHHDSMPMSGDILRIEHFLTPGTIILIDGRAANARFIRCNLQRKWEYSYCNEHDQHQLELVEDPLGKYNKRQLSFYTS